MASGNGRHGGAPTFAGWVVVVDAGGDLVGKIRGGDLAQAEQDVRKEMAEGATPSVSLAPVYRLTSQIVHVNGQPQRLTSINTLEGALDLGKNARLPFHVLLTNFAFLSELDDESRVALQRKIDDAERTTAAARSNILLAR